MEQNNNNPAPTVIQSTTRRLAFSLLYFVALPAAGLQAISLDSVFAGYLAMGALQAFGLAALVIGIPAFLLAPAALRHRLLSRLVMVFSIFGVLSVFLLRGKVNQLQAAGETTTRIAFTPTLIVLLIQVGLAAVYILHARRQQPRADRRGPAVPRWSWVPVALFVPVLLVGGFVGVPLFGGDSVETAQDTVTEPGAEKYSHFPKPADFEFARETTRAGENFGGEFIHYHTGQQPLIGVTFSSREWHRHKRISSDLRGIFDREAPKGGDHWILAKPGYAVAGLEAQVDENVHAIRIRFARLDGSGLDMTDAYWSSWTGGAGPEIIELGGSGDRVLGLTGTAGLVVNSLGLMMETTTLSEQTQYD